MNDSLPDVPRSERHVVMIVDNGVVGDSRVQKQASSMADMGWRVTVVGRGPKNRRPHTVEFPGFRALLVPLEFRTGYRGYLYRHPLLRSPLSYRSLRVARGKDAAAEVRVLRARDAIDLRKSRGTDAGLARLVGRARMAVARTTHQVAHYRHDKTEDIHNTRMMATGAWDRAAIRWWTRLRGDRAWSRLDPGIWDWEMAFGPVVDRLKPDLIHANDHRMLAIGARAKHRARARGREVKLVWDAHEWLPGVDRPSYSRRWKAAQVLLERSFAREADAVVTVSATLATMLRNEHDLPELPAVVVNAPLMSGTSAPPADVRQVVGLGPDVPVLLYSGGITPARSVDTIVRALPELPGAHFVIVVLDDTSPAVLELLTLARELGVDDRVHTAPYVPVDQIVAYLAGADVGIHSLLHGPNNEIALATKFYEYAQARLPIVVTDVKEMSQTTVRLGLGEVCKAGDAADLARAVRLVLADTERYRNAYDDPELMRSWTWETQAAELDAVYRRMLTL
jgi:glycogen(starch) synthase